MVMADSELISAYANDRDAEAFRQLVQRHIDFVYAAAVRQSADCHSAQDIAQAVFVLLAQRAESLRSLPTLKGWLFNTTRYVAINARRSLARRKLREKEAAAMRSEILEQSQTPDVSPHLDDALARLPERDRQVLLLRFFDDLPLAQVSGVLGISQHAAKKRLTRAIERVRVALERRGTAVASTSLATLLSASAAQAAPAPLADAAFQLVCGGATKTATANSALPLAKETAKMMSRNKLKWIAIKTAMGTVFATAAAAAVVLQRPRPRPAAISGPQLLDNQPVLEDVPDPNQVAQWQFDACCGVLRSFIDAYDHNDPAALHKLIYFNPKTAPEVVTIADLIWYCDLATYRLQKIAVAKFGAQGTGLVLNDQTDVALMVDWLARIQLKDAQIAGDEIVITPTRMPHSPVWPQAPIFFRHSDAGWQLDCGRTFRFDIHAVRSQPLSGESEQQAWAAGEHLFGDGLNAIAEDLEKGKIQDIAEVQRRFEDVNEHIATTFRRLGMNTNPAQ